MADVRPIILRQMISLGLKPDKRLIPARPDLAAGYLRGEVEAKKYVTGVKRSVCHSQAGLRKRPDLAAPLQTQLLFGETVTVYDENENWAWLQAETDGYVGYVESAALVAAGSPATHKIIVPRTHLYPQADLKTVPAMALPAMARLAVSGDVAVNGFRRLEAGGWVYEKHLRPADWRAPDLPDMAMAFLNAPYLWGGRTAAGLDCSGLLQISLALTGIAALRDTDQQAETIGVEIPNADLNKLRTGDLVFFPGHVGIMTDAEHLLHANATAMQVTIDPLEDVVRIIGKTHAKPVTAVRRAR